MDLKILNRLININSFTKHLAGVQSCTDILTHYCQKIKGCRIKQYKKQGYAPMLFIKNDCQMKNPVKVLLSGHIDTVHEPGENEVLFYQKKDKIFGDGSCDMKGGIAALLQIFELCSNLPIQLSAIFNIDEEADMCSFADELALIYQGNDLMLVFECGDSLDGTYNFAEKTKTIVTQRKGFGSIHIECFGKNGHSGVLSKKDERVNAIQEIAHKVLELEKLADYSKGITYNPGIIHGGKLTNVIPEFASLDADIRYFHKRDKKKILDDLNSLQNLKYHHDTLTKVFVDLLVEPLEETILTERYFVELQKASEQMGIKISKEIRGGMSDANNAQSANPSLVIFDGLGPFGKEDHTKHEWISYNSLIQSIELVTAFLHRIAYKNLQ